MKTILVPTDFSKNAENALNYAARIAKKEKARLLLLHAYDITFVIPDMPLSFYSEELAGAKAEGELLLSEACKWVRGKFKVQCDILCVQGQPVDVIPGIIVKRRIKLVVMGTKGASGLSEILGSNTASVIMKTKCPVIAVPQKAVFSNIRQITFATDFFEGDYDALKRLTAFARLHNAGIRVVHVEEPDYADESGTMEKFKRKVKTKVDYKRISFEMLSGKDPEKSLLKHLRENASDLLAITSGDKTWLERFLFRSLSKKLIYHTKVPLMVFHLKR